MAPFAEDSEVQYHPDGMTSGGMVGPIVGIVGAVLASTAVGLAWDLWAARRGKSSDTASHADGVGTLRGWVLGMLVSSYALLIPGLMSHLFEAKTDLIIFVPQNLSEYDETMVSLIARLFNDNMILGSILVALYSIVIPLGKIVMLLLGMYLRRSGCARDLRLSRMCILVVHAISKWASPDMFAYILLMNLMRGLNKPPTLRSGMELDLGFTCFCVFCVGSTVSSLGIRVPTLPAKECSAEVAAPAKPHLSLGCAAGMVTLLALLFGGLLGLGLARPSMSLYIDMPLLYTVKPDLAELKVVLEYLHVDELLQDKVSVWECLFALARWAAQGEVNSAIALFLYAGCAVLLPVVDMCLILATMLLKIRQGSKEEVGNWSSRVMATSLMLRKTSMLDVSVMGSLVVVASLRTLRAKGVIIEVCSGAFLLLAASVCHHVAAFVAQRALIQAPQCEPSTTASTKSIENVEVDSYGVESRDDSTLGEEDASVSKAEEP